MEEKNIFLDLFATDCEIFSGSIIANFDKLNVYRNKYDAYKKYVEILEESLKDQKNIISKDGLERIKNCSSWFQFEVSSSFADRRVKRANRCNHKFCPFCSRTKALKRSLEAQAMMQELASEKYRFLFITLTTKNVNYNELKNEMTHINKSVNQNLLKYKDIKKCFYGTIRKFELTYNPYVYNKKTKDLQLDEKGQKIFDPYKKPFNAHMHLIVAVKSSYFGRNYISTEKLAKMWQKALKVNYTPLVDIQSIKSKEMSEEEKEQFESDHSEYISKDQNKFVNGSFEIGKYIAKDSDYLLSNELFEQFYKSLFKRRNWTFTGVFKELHAQNKGVRFESILENANAEYDYIVDYNHNRITNDYEMTRVLQKNKIL